MDLSNFVEKAKELNVLGVKVSQNGELIGEWHSEAECRRNVYSATKSFTSCAVGFAVQEGLLSLDEKLTEAFVEDLPKEVDENLKKATVRDLLTMCLGQKEGSLMGEQRPLYEEDDWVKLSLSLPFVYEPARILSTTMSALILQVSSSSGAPAVIWFLTSRRAFSNILASSVRPGRRIL